jgi:cysteine desulfurase/selenocysteine lyase
VASALTERAEAGRTRPEDVPGAVPAEAAPDLDVARLRQDFPTLKVPAPNGGRLVFLDSAASAQRPRAVLDAMDAYYNEHHANVHRGVYALAEDATARYEAARRRAGAFVGAPDPAHEIVFTKNVTESMNLVARSLGASLLSPGDVVVLTEMEHHANLVPWQQLALERGIELRYLSFDDEGELVLDDAERLLEGARVLSVTLASNVLGTLNPLPKLAALAHAQGALVVADGAQWAPHLPTSVRELGVDLLGWTGHKMLGPTGIGVLWGRADLLEQLPPFLGGGEMISDVRLDGFTPAEVPLRFEAGTPPIAEAIGLAAAIEYLEVIGLEALRRHEVELTTYALDQLADRLPAVWVLGPKNPLRRGGIIAFNVPDVHPHDVSQVLDSKGVCVRAGHHCAKPLHRKLGLSASTRASFYLYNDRDDVDAFVDGLAETLRLFGVPTS